MRLLFKLILIILIPISIYSQNVIIIVMDGARYTETFGAEDPNMFIPHLWNDLKPLGTLFTNFRNEGYTETVPGHSSILTGTWQHIANNGSERPTKPTLFEYFRKEYGVPESENYVVAGKYKLNVLSYSTDSDYGSDYRASYIASDIEDNQVFSNVSTVMNTYHPRLMIINFPSVDREGHSGNWAEYTAAITVADSLIYEIWQQVESDGFYKDSTTVFITNDHGRHDDAHGGFQNHGDNCEGCQHIMMLALGKDVQQDAVITQTKYQIDIAPTVGQLLSFDTPKADGGYLFVITGIKDKGNPKTGYELFQNYPNPFNPTTIIKYSLNQAANVEILVHDILGRKVATLVDAYKLPGVYQEYFDGSNLSSGIYFYQLAANNFVQTKKFILMK